MDARISLRVDGRERSVTVDTRTTLLDALRERLSVTSPKKGCDHGQCGACTVLLEGRRQLSCLTFAVAHDGEEVTTAAGLGDGQAVAAAGAAAAGAAAAGAATVTAGGGDGLHPVQRAFLEQDGFQCGYCTPGQVCSAVGMLAEAAAGDPSHATEDLTATVAPDAPARLDDDEIRERMSGNLCRCGAYPNILSALRDMPAESAQPAKPHEVVS